MARKLDKQRTELERLRKQNLMGSNWQDMMPFPCDDAMFLSIVSDRVPTSEDRIEAQCPVVWLYPRGNQVWKSFETGVWIEEEVGSFVAITNDGTDTFVLMHAGQYPGFRSAVEIASSSSVLLAGDPRVLGIDPTPFGFMDATISPTSRAWRAFRGVLPQTDAPDAPDAPAPRPVSPPTIVQPVAGRRPIVLDPEQSA